MAINSTSNTALIVTAILTSVLLTSASYAQAQSETITAESAQAPHLIEFRIAQGEAASGFHKRLGPDNEVLFVSDEVGLSSADVSEVNMIRDAGLNPAIMVIFTPKGAARLTALTRENIGRRLAISAEGRMLNAPTIRGGITGGRVLLSLGSAERPDEMMREATSLIKQLRSQIDGRTKSELAPKKPERAQAVQPQQEVNRAKELTVSGVMGNSQSFSARLKAVTSSGAGGELVMGHGVGGMGLRGTGSGGRKGMGKALVSKSAKRIRARINTGTPNVRGACQLSKVQKILTMRERVLLYCYERALVREPDLSGEVIVAWTITAEGRAVKPHITQSALKSDRVESCVRHAIKRIRFAKPKQGECEVSVSLNFKYTEP